MSGTAPRAAISAIQAAGGAPCPDASGQRSLRFLVLTQYFPPEIGAPQTRLPAVIRELMRLGHKAEVVTSLPNYPTGQMFPGYRRRFYMREEWEGVPVHRVWLYPAMGKGLKRVLNYASFALTSLLGLIRSRRPDYIFVESPPLFLSLPARLASIWWRKPFIFNVADLWPDSVRELGLIRNGLLLRAAAWLERRTYQRACFVCAVTEGIQATLIERKGVPRKKIAFLPNGVDTNLFKPAPPDRELACELGLCDSKIVLFAGNLGYFQGAEVAVRAARLMKEEGVTFVFVGTGSEKADLVCLARAISADNVVFLAPVPSEQVARLHTLAMAGLTTLRKSPLLDGTRPSKTYPIMASGKPVLYSGSGEGARLVEEARAGLVVPPEDPEALAEAVRTLVKDPKLAVELGRNGRQYAEEHLNWATLVGSWLRQLEGENREGARVTSPSVPALTESEAPEN